MNGRTRAVDDPICFGTIHGVGVAPVPRGTPPRPTFTVSVRLDSSRGSLKSSHRGSHHSWSWQPIMRGRCHQIVQSIVVPPFRSWRMPKKRRSTQKAIRVLPCRGLAKRSSVGDASRQNSAGGDAAGVLSGRIATLLPIVGAGFAPVQHQST
jgi:hypothetical protein